MVRVWRIGLVKKRFAKNRRTRCLAYINMKVKVIKDLGNLGTLP